MTKKHIEKHLENALEISRGSKDQTVLFFDEANTSDAIGLIKEVIMDESINGEKLEKCGLVVIAACNPYRRYALDI